MLVCFKIMLVRGVQKKYLYTLRGYRENQNKHLLYICYQLSQYFQGFQAHPYIIEVHSTI